MSAGKQNPFVVGFAVVMVLGAGALGYLTYSASEEHAQARSDYDDKAAELRTLQGSRPFPNDEHLKKFQTQRDELQAKADELQKSLSALKIPIEDISPTGFQDKLRDAVARVKAQAPEANVELPKDFYMGMQDYQGTPPKGPAAPPLYRELRAIEAVVNLILEVKNVQFTELKRAGLKEEQDAKPATTSAGGQKNKPRDEGRKLVEKETFMIKFSTTQENFQRILNGIVTHKEQFFIPRHLVIANEKLEAPAKAPAVAAAPPPPPPDAVVDPANPVTPPGPAPAGATPPAPDAPAAAPEQPKLEYIFGKELVTVTMEIDLVDVKTPEAKPEGKPEAKK